MILTLAASTEYIVRDKMREFMMDSPLLSLLACPKCHGTLTQGTPCTLTCAACHLTFPIENGLPVLLIEKALTTERPAPAQAT